MVRTSQQLQQLFQKSKEEKEKQQLELQELKRLKKREKDKRYRETHREKIKLYQLVYREKNKESQREYQKQYREAHKDIAKEYQEQYRKKQKDLLNPTENSIVKPPVTTKKQVQEMYQKWLKNLKDREPYLKGFKQYCNQLMQKSIENEMRTKLTTEEVKQFKSPMQKLEEKAQMLINNAKTAEEKNVWKNNSIMQG